MLVPLWSTLTSLLAFSVSALLPGPQSLRMDAVNTRYILRWDWNQTAANHMLRNQTAANHTVRFTADWTYWRGDGFYKTVCKMIRECWCDFSPSELDYSGSFELRVRAEAGAERSSWAMQRFTPDEDALLGAPSRVELEGEDAMVTVTITAPLGMDSIMELSYRVQYWEGQDPQQEQCKDIAEPSVTLTGLKPWTEYCVQVRANSKHYSKTSHYTPTQCTHTRGTGHPPVWQVVLAVVCALVVTSSLSYTCCRRMDRLPVYKTPHSILSPPISHLSLLEPVEESCAAVAVLTVQTEQQEEEREARLLHASSSQHSKSSLGQDSGICSGEDSGGQDASTTTQGQTVTVTTATPREESP